MKKEFYFRSNNHKLFGVYEKAGDNNGIVAILLHGLTNSHDTCPLINEANSKFVKNGISTFRFDYYGSGKSDGLFIDKSLKEMMINTKDAYEFVMNNLNAKKLIIWGRSFGAILAPYITDKINIIACILISGTTHTNISMKDCFTNEDYSKPFKATGLIKGKPILPRSFYIETIKLDEQIQEQLQKTKNILIFQGTKDKTVYDMNWAKEMYNSSLEPKKLIFIKGADHTYKGFENQVIDESLSWIKNRLEDQTP